jgi:hypothetical protein
VEFRLPMISDSAFQQKRLIRVQALFCPADQTGVWALQRARIKGKGKMSPREVGQLQAIAKQKNLSL